MVNTIVIKGADFTDCAVDVRELINFKTEENIHSSGYYAGTITVGTTTLESIFTFNTGYTSYLVPITANHKYKIKKYKYGSGSNLLTWAVIDANGVILAYYKYQSAYGEYVSETEINMSDYPDAAKLVLAWNNDSTLEPSLVDVTE